MKSKVYYLQLWQRDHFEVKIMLEMDYILSIKVKRMKDKIRIFQRTYVKRMLKKFSIANCKLKSISLSVGMFLLVNNSPTNEKEVINIKNVSYYEALGLLIWLQVDAQPVLLFTINLLLYFISNPNYTYWEAMKHMLAYVKDILEYGITYHKEASL